MSGYIRLLSKEAREVCLQPMSRYSGMSGYWARVRLKLTCRVLNHDTCNLRYCLKAEFHYAIQLANQLALHRFCRITVDRM